MTTTVDGRGLVRNLSSHQQSEGEEWENQIKDDRCITKIHQGEDHDAVNIDDLDKNSVRLLSVEPMSSEYCSEAPVHEEMQN